MDRVRGADDPRVGGSRRGFRQRSAEWERGYRLRHNRINHNQKFWLWFAVHHLHRLGAPWLSQGKRVDRGQWSAEIGVGGVRHQRDSRDRPPEQVSRSNQPSALRSGSLRRRNDVLKISAFAFIVLVSGTSLAMAQAASGKASGLWGSASGGATASGPSIAGKFESEVHAKNITATASGKDSTARNVIGSATDGNANEFKSKVEIEGDVKAEATGESSCAENIVGSMGSSACTGK